MNFDRFAGLFAASAICLTLAFAAWTGIVGPIWQAGHTATPDQWLGFLGSVVGALATLVAALIALFAAYKTLKPMRAQLDQLIKQNDYILFERLKLRATRLNDEQIVVQRVAANCAVVSHALESFEGDSPAVGMTVSTLSNPVTAISGLQDAVERLAKSVEEMQKQAGEVWGDVTLQTMRREFAKLALQAGSQAIKMLSTAERHQRTAHILLKQDIKHWKQHSDKIHRLGAELFDLGRTESKRIGGVIADIERRLF